MNTSQAQFEPSHLDAWQQTCQKLREQNSNLELYEHFSPKLDSTGYPPSFFQQWDSRDSNKKSPRRAAESVIVSVRAVLRTVALWLVVRPLRSRFVKRLNKTRYLEVNTEWGTRRRKQITVQDTPRIITDVNFEFLKSHDLRAFASNRSDATPFFCSLSYLSLRDIFVSVLAGIRISIADRDIGLPQNNVGRTINNILKGRALSSVMRRHNRIVVCLFWENRGFQNFLAESFPCRVIFFSLGDEGAFGPVFLNHMQRQLANTCFFSSARMMDLVSSRFTGDQAQAATIRGLSLRDGPFADSISKLEVNEVKMPVNAEICFLQSHSDFSAERLKKLRSLGSIAQVMFHPEFRGSKDGLRVWQARDDRSLMNVYFVFAGVTTSAYQCWLSFCNIAFLRLGDDPNCLADLGVSEVSVLDLEQGWHRGELSSLFTRRKIDEKNSTDQIRIFQDLDSLLAGT